MVSNGTDGILIENTFHFNPKSDQPDFKITVTCVGISCIPIEHDERSSKVLWRKTPKPVMLNMEDVVGCKMKDKGKAHNNYAHLDVIAYPHHKVFASKRTQRRREVVALTFRKHDSYDENVKMARDWQTVIQSVAKGQGFQEAQEASSSGGTSNKILVLVNPFGGTGRALKTFLEKVVPPFKDANIEYEMISTERQGHAQEMMKTLTLTDYYGVVIVSGDGLVYEVINGLMARDDWETAIKMPIGVIPGGSGNAICSAISWSAGEPFLSEPVLPAAFVIIKHQLLPMDLVAVDTPQGRLYSFLSISWGIIPDIDIESERYRSLGMARFTLGAISRIVGLRRYRGRVSFLPVGEYHSKEVTTSMTRSKSESAPPRTTTDEIKTSQSLDLSGAADAKVPLKPALEKVSLDNEAKSGHVVDETGDSGTVSESTSMKDDKPVNGCSSDSSTTPPLPGLDEPVPSGWVTIEDNFVLLLAMYQTHLNSELIPAPDCEFNDAVIHLILVRASITRARILRIMLAFEEGKEMNDDAAEIVRVKAFRLEPLTEHGILTVDGESVKYGPIQAHVLPSLARIMAMKKSIV